MFKVLFMVFFFLSSLYAEENVLKFGLFPYDSPVEQYESFSHIKDYLEKELKIKVKIVIAYNYITQIKNIGEGVVDLALLGPLPYVKVEDKFKNITLVAKLNFEDERMNNIVFISQKNSPINSLEDLKDRTFAFGDYNSCGSHFFPRYILKNNKINLLDFKYYDYLGSHSKVILAVANGDFEAGAVREDIYLKYIDRNIKVIAGPYKIDPHVIAANNKLSRELISKIKGALYKLKDKNILYKFEDEFAGFLPVNDSDFKVIREIVKEIEKE